MSSSKKSQNKTIKDVLGIKQMKSNSHVPKIPLKKFTLKTNNIVTY